MSQYLPCTKSYARYFGHITCAQERKIHIQNKWAKHYLTVLVSLKWQITSRRYMTHELTFWVDTDILMDLSHFSPLIHVKHKARNEMPLPYDLLPKSSQWLSLSKSSSFIFFFHIMIFTKFYDVFLMSGIIWKKYFSIFILIKVNTAV